MSSISALRRSTTPRRVVVAGAVAAALTMTAAPAQAGHAHFVYIDSTGVCQYVAHGQTAIDDDEHGGKHRFHDQVHTGAPGSDDRGTDVDKSDNEGDYDCTPRGRR